MEEACIRLWHAVLDRAIRDMVDPRTKFKDREEARQWFQSERQEVGSFLWVCNILGFNPGTVRSRLTTYAVAVSYSYGLFSQKPRLFRENVSAVMGKNRS
jgi:hypothetical protein